MTIDRETVSRLAREANSYAYKKAIVAWDYGSIRDMYFAALVLEHGRKPLTDGGQIADLILRDPDGGEMRISSDLQEEQDGAVRFTVTNPKTCRRFGVYVGITELTPAHGITNKDSSDAE